MNTNTLFFVEILMGLCVSLAVVGVIRQPLRILLNDLCGTEERSQFWTTYTCLMLVITPLLANSLLGTDASFAFFDVAWFRKTMTYSLMGIFVSLTIVGHQIRNTIPQKGIH